MTHNPEAAVSYAQRFLIEKGFVRDNSVQKSQDHLAQDYENESRHEKFTVTQDHLEDVRSQAHDISANPYKGQSTPRATIQSEEWGQRMEKPKEMAVDQSTPEPSHHEEQESRYLNSKGNITPFAEGPESLHMTSEEPKRTEVVHEHTSRVPKLEEQEIRHTNPGKSLRNQVESAQRPSRSKSSFFPSKYYL